MIDLHCHTNASDGEKTPEELVTEALALGLTAIAITDHDTIAGIGRAMRAAEGTSLEIVPGIEFSGFHRGKEIHILGYLLPLDDPTLLGFLQRMTIEREARGREMVAKINEIGFELTYDEAALIADGAPIMSPHIARALWKKGTLKDYTQVLEFYLDHLVQGADAYVEHHIEIDEVLGILKEIGCPAAIAHPHKINDDSIVGELIAMGLQGMEGYYPETDEEVLAHYREWARREGMFASGGSDYHGIYSTRKLGKAHVPDEVLDQIKSVRDKMRG